MFNLDAAVCTDVGKVRNNNEDNYYLCGKYKADTSQNNALLADQRAAAGALYSVCDGMGGAEKGELASLIAVQSLQGCTISEFQSKMTQKIMQINLDICNEIQKNGGVRIGSTLAALCVDNNRAMACNLGDSRVYYLHAGALRQISVDHNEAQSMVNMGLVSKEQARHQKEKHRLTQHLGIFPDEMIIEPYFSEEINLEAGDKFLLCSDGLTDMLDDLEIQQILQKDLPAEQLAKALTDAAVAAGGKDNCTVLVVTVKDAATASAKRPITKRVPLIVGGVAGGIVLVCVALWGSRVQSYNKGLAYIESGSYQQALNTLSKVNYKDSTALCEDLRTYLQAIELQSSADYEGAAALFENLGDFADSSSQLQLCLQAISMADKQSQYDTAVEYMESEDYTSARKIFLSLRDYQDSAAKADLCTHLQQEAQYNDAVKAEKKSDYEAAYRIYAELGDYLDSTARAEECRYQYAVQLMEQGEYKTARIHFLSLGTYEDSKDKAAECEELVNQATPETAQKVTSPKTEEDE